MDCVNGRLNLGSALLLTNLLRKEIYHAAKVRWWSFSYLLLWGKTAEELHMTVAIKCSNKLFSHLKCTASLSFWLTTPLPHWRRIGNSFMICLRMWSVDGRQAERHFILLSLGFIDVWRTSKAATTVHSFIDYCCSNHAIVSLLLVCMLQSFVCLFPAAP